MSATGDRIVVERAFTQADFDAFAELSGDANPIHVDPDFAARTRFGRTVAHGLLLCTVLRGLVEKLVPGGRQTAQDLMFPAPTFAGERMRFAAAIVERTGEERGIELRVSRIADDQITCQGRTTVVDREASMP